MDVLGRSIKAHHPGVCCLLTTYMIMLCSIRIRRSDRKHKCQYQLTKKRGRADEKAGVSIFSTVRWRSWYCSTKHNLQTDTWHDQTVILYYEIHSFRIIDQGFIWSAALSAALRQCRAHLSKGTPFSATRALVPRYLISTACAIMINKKT